MSIILGIDIGGSTTKIVGLRSDGTTIAMHRVQAQDPITSLYGAMGNFLFTNRLQLGDVSRIALTGVGASYIDDDIYGIPTEKVEEFAAVGVGGLALSGQDRAVVVSMGTGTAFIWAEKGKPVRHLCGSGVPADREAGLGGGRGPGGPDGGRPDPEQPSVPAAGYHGGELRERLRRRGGGGFCRRGHQYGLAVHRHHCRDGLPVL